MLDGIIDWLSNQTPSFDWEIDPADSVLALLEKSFASQSAIGWDSLLRGRISKTWFCAHDEYCRQRGLDSRFHSTHLGADLVKALWSLSLAHWHSRNAYVHGATSAEVNT